MLITHFDIFVPADGKLRDWTASERIHYSDASGYNLYGQAQSEDHYFALVELIVVGANTTFWFNTGRNTATEHQIFDFAGGAECNVNIKGDGTAALYNSGADQTLVFDNLPIAYSADHKSIEFASSKTAIGSPGIISTLYDFNDAVFTPSSYSAQPYIAMTTMSSARIQRTRSPSSALPQPRRTTPRSPPTPHFSWRRRARRCRWALGLSDDGVDGRAFRPTWPGASGATAGRLLLRGS